MGRVWISALFTEISAIKNLRIAKAYRQQTARTHKMLELLSFMTRRLVTPDEENHLCFLGKVSSLFRVAECKILVPAMTRLGFSRGVCLVLFKFLQLSNKVFQRRPFVDVVDIDVADEPFLVDNK